MPLSNERGGYVPIKDTATQKRPADDLSAAEALTAESLGPYGEEAKDFQFQPHDVPPVAPAPFVREPLQGPKSPWLRRKELRDQTRAVDVERLAEYERALELMADTLEGRVTREIVASSRIEMRNGVRTPVHQLRTEGDLVAAYPQSMVFDGTRYEVVDEIGEGGRGVVVEVRPIASHSTDVDLHERGMRIVKLVVVGDRETEERATSREFLKRLLANEIDANDLEGTYVAGKLYENEKGEQVYALLLEKGTGQSLDQLMKESPERLQTHEGRAVLLRAAAAVVGQLRAMERRGWTHHDVKPSNMLIDWEHPERSRLIDHGVSAERGMWREGREGMIVGPGETSHRGARTMLFQPREAIAEQEEDLRVRDLYGLALSFGMAMGVFTRNEDVKSIAEIGRQSYEPADRFMAARLLGDEEVRDEHWRELGWLRPEREAIALLYDVVRPHDSAVARMRFWRDRGVTPDTVGRRLEALSSEAEHARAAMLVVEAARTGVLGEDVPRWRVRRVEEALARFDGARDEAAASHAYMEMVEALEEMGVGDLFARHHEAMQDVVRESREAEARALRRRGREVAPDVTTSAAAHIKRRRLHRAR